MVIKDVGGVVMDYISEVFERLNLQHIREFLLCGAECIGVSDKSYKERLEESYNMLVEQMGVRFSDKDETDAVLNDICRYITTVETDYMEMGMQCGAALVIKLLGGVKLE